LEANAAAAYFRAWKGMPIKWRGTNWRPIPDSWEAIEQRTSSIRLAGNRSASHPVNAILNYAYAVLQSQIQINAVAEGYDPTIGVMHEARDGSSAFVFDLMEPERPTVDRKVLEFIKGLFQKVKFVSLVWFRTESGVNSCGHYLQNLHKTGHSTPADGEAAFLVEINGATIKRN
jgi:CRISPR-associated endonuclease Cas1